MKNPNQEKSIVNQYMDEVRKVAVLPRKEKAELLWAIENEIGYCMEQIPSCTYEDLLELEGQPEEAVERYMEELELSPSPRAEKRRRIFISVFAFALAGILIAAAITIGYIQSRTEVKATETIVIRTPKDNATPTPTAS